MAGDTGNGNGAASSSNGASGPHQLAISNSVKVTPLTAASMRGVGITNGYSNDFGDEAVGQSSVTSGLTAAPSHVACVLTLQASVGKRRAQ